MRQETALVQDEYKEIDNGNQAKLRDVTLGAESQRALAETQAAIAIAMRRPRTEAQAQANLERTLERKSFCEKAIYIFPRGGENVVGPSINLAREIARLWGNIQCGYKIVHDEGDDRTIEGFAWDLETNSKIIEQITFKKIREKKDFKTGRLIAQGVSERDLREITAKHGALAVRNCILQLIPRDIVDDAVEKSQEIIAKNIEKEDIKKVRVKTLNAFEEMGVMRESLEEYLGHSIDKATLKEVVELRGIYKSINDGVSKKEEYFGKTKKDAATTPKENLNQIGMQDLIGDTVV